MPGLFKGAKELAELAGLDKKAAAYLKRLAQRVKEAKTKKGKKLAQTKSDIKTGDALARIGRKQWVSEAPIIPRPRAKGGKVYKVDNSGQQMVAKQYGGKVK
jgi:hypothetical protein